MRPLKILLTTLALITVSCGAETPVTADATRAAGETEHCRNVGAATYWFYYFQQGVEELERSSDSVRWKGKKGGPCWVTYVEDLLLTEPTVGDPGPKTIGAVNAVSDLGPFIDSPDHRERVDGLLAPGADLSGVEEFAHWWARNGPFLRWSDAEGALVMDERAKRLEEPVINFDPAVEFSATDLWYWDGFRDVYDITEKDGMIEGRYITTNHHRINARFTAPATALRDREAKESGYLKAASHLIGGLKNEKLRKAESLERYPHVKYWMEELKEITTQAFERPEPWIEWWDRCGEELELDPEGARLIGVDAKVCE